MMMDYSDLTFGTAGIRGLMGDDKGCLNNGSIGAIAESLAQAMDDMELKGTVVICRDSRNQGKEFADLSAEIMADYGHTVYLGTEPLPTPFLSYAIRVLKAVGGINITASHNPKEYNGFKAYGSDGAQIDTAYAEKVQAKLRHFSSAKQNRGGKVLPIPQEVYDLYLKTIVENLALSKVDFGDLKAVYSPLHGSAGAFMTKLKEMAHLPLIMAENQMKPDGDFPLAPKPNPENPEVFDPLISQVPDADLILTNDPDGDRLGVMVKDGDSYRLLSGNEAGLVLLYYLLTKEVTKTQGKFAAKSLVSSSLAETLCSHYGIPMVNVLVGFRYIASEIEKNEEGFLFGFEESGGYLAHPHARDKDGLEAACLILKAAAVYQKENRTLCQVLDEIYNTFGYVIDVTYSLEIPLEQCSKLMATVRSYGIDTIAGENVVSLVDLLAEESDMKANIIVIKTANQRVILRPSGTEPKMKVYIS
ncbi:MAG: phospho-sugar mutase, partial [Bacillota bacterium]|nr:phospho-sugar mutase [Bacillota bacterium]